MLLNIYLGASLLCAGSICLITAYLENKLKKEGYKEKEKDTIFVHLIFALKTLLYSLTPILNIYIIYRLLIQINLSEMYEDLKEDMIKSNEIYKEDEKEEHVEEQKVESKIMKEQEVLEKEPAKKYEYMTIPEKKAYLEQEMAGLADLLISLGQESSVEDNDYPRERRK